MNPSPDQLQEEAFRQVLAHRTMLKAYVQVIVRDPLLAEDTFSDVTLEIVRSWNRFDRNRSFEYWARGVARRVALANLRRRGRQPVTVDDEVLEALGEEVDRFGDEPQLAERKDALQRCLEKLPENSRELIRLRYFEERAYPDIAHQLGRTLGALYVAFNRIHETLARCVERGLRSP